MTAPLVLALGLVEADQERLDALRREHFPRARNQLRAHVTMFHQLPGEELDAVLSAVEAGTARPPFEVRVEGVRSLGRGVALTLASPELAAVRAGVARAAGPWLTRQDAQRWNPHVTVANFLPAEEARALLERLRAGFTPWSVRARAVEVHRYLGGPWELVRSVPFTGAG